MAGLLDGEGTIGIASFGKGQYRSPYISISSTTPEIMEWLKDNFQGSVSTHKTYQDHHKQSWSWKLTKLDSVKNLLSEVTPYMLEPDKVRRANMILTEYSIVTVRNGKYSPEQLSKKLDFEARFLRR